MDELWLACHGSAGVAESVGERVRGLFDEAPEDEDAVVETLAGVLRGLDAAINEAAVTRELRVRVGSSGGRLMFGTAEALTGLEAFRGFQFAVLVDEFENFSELQQECVNTLIREKQPRVSFLVGARTFGVKTRRTWGGEENREGSEFETIVLDSVYRSRPESYERFCRTLVARRLVRAGVGGKKKEEEATVASGLARHFAESGRAGSGESEAGFVGEGRADTRKCLIKLRGQLERFRPMSITDAEVEEVIELLHCRSDPVVEKLSVYLFYRAWHGRKNPLTAAATIAEEARVYEEGDRRGRFAVTMGHFKGNMVAQLLAEYKQRQRYLGFGECVALSGGLPRALLVVLKHVFRWSVFNGETPFEADQKVGEGSQRAGVAEAARWFARELPSIGPEGVAAWEAVERLGRLLRALRFSDKPAESSACTVSLDRLGLAAEVASTVNHCVEFSFLLPIEEGHKDRNTGDRKEKLQVHPMLCPLWDLPTGRRGVVELSMREVVAVFGREHGSVFDEVMRVRLSRMNAPFGVGAGDGGLVFDG